MQAIIKKLSELVPPEKNVRIHTEKQLKEFEKSVNMFGQIRPIVVDENNVILTGNGLYKTLQRMGWQEAECYQYTNLTENQKKKLMIADNRIFSLGIENLDTLNSFLEELQSDLDIPGFDEEILKQMISDADDITSKLSEYGTLDQDEINDIKEKNVKREQEPVQPDTPVPNHALPVTPAEPTLVQREAAEEAADIKKFLICPECGKKIWL